MTLNGREGLGGAWDQFLVIARTNTCCCSKPSLGSDFYLLLPADECEEEGGKCCEREAAAGTILPDWRSQSDDRDTRRHLCVGALAGPIAAQTKVTKHQ